MYSFISTHVVYFDNLFICRAEIFIGGAKGPPDKVSAMLSKIGMLLYLLKLSFHQKNLHSTHAFLFFF